LANAAAQPAQQLTSPPAGRAFVANETGGAISVIDAATGGVVGTYCLGSDRADDVAGTPAQALVGPCDQEQDHHRPLYDGHAGPHGAWLTPDGRVLLIANRLSGTVVALDTSVDPAQSCESPMPPTPCVNAILGYTPTGREPHLATVHPNGQEAWVATRGERFIEVLMLNTALLFSGARPIDRMPRIATIDTLPGPSMVSFTPDGQFAFVVHAKAPVVHKINAITRQVVASQGVPAPFTPFGLVTPDGQELYTVHKNAGTLSILRTSDLGFVVQGLPVGPRGNHVYYVGNLAYVTIGGPAPGAAAPDPLGGLVIINRQTHAIVAASPGYTGRPDVPAYAPSGFTDWTGEPHGIWATADGGRLLVGHERGNRVTILDTGDPNDPFDDAFVQTVSEPLMRQPIDIVINAGPTGGEPTPTATPTATGVPATATNTPGPAEPSPTSTTLPSATSTPPSPTLTATTGPVATATHTPAPTSVPSATPLRGEALAVVGICHATRSESKPYLYVEVREDAAASHRDHGDIIGVDSQANCPVPAARR
jgi:DNA-binding beta-propeller fold protein YncE